MERKAIPVSKAVSSRSQQFCIILRRPRHEKSRSGLVLHARDASLVYSLYEDRNRVLSFIFSNIAILTSVVLRKRRVLS